MAPPLITITLVVCQESIPLQDPREGWKANFGFWPRVGVLGAFVGSAAVQISCPWLGLPPPSSRQQIACSACLGSALIVVGMATSALWVFPVPFFVFSVLLPVSCLFLPLLYVVCLIGMMSLAYPSFQVLFNKANHTVNEVPVLLLLPAFKIATKRLYALLASQKWDMVPEQIVFTVDFFDALYLATCMPSVSTTSLAVILVVDIAQTGVDLLELHQRTQSILARLRTAGNIRGDCSLLSAVRLLCCNPEILRNQEIDVFPINFHTTIGSY
ncbi:hypothetical protein JG688_00012076 [Phytophthora aleatoria]|uniref:Uncharacterized protein n=1 Tax=Phytophthora aleatoria TaxID=2496075 RepID=A0A8J5J3G9_9STRA|nr:hypothetical protein JG688_00012076 [Phytophthora aleatoria]